MKLAWSEQMSVGNVIVDSEHRNLISLVNDTIHAIKTRNDSDLALAFEQLERALCVHIETEERIARAAGFDFSRLKLAKTYGLEELQYLKSELVGGHTLWSEKAVEHFIHFLKNWLIDEHIVWLDMQMKPVLQNRDYNFIPEA